MPLAIDLCCGLGGWTEGLIAEGYDVIGFDIEQHVYGEHRYPGLLVIQDVLTLHGSQFKNANLIVASPPCQEYSYMAMPWKRAKALAAEYRSGVRDVKKLTALFDACFRIQREACEASGRHIPLIVENVRGAIPWVGRSRWNFGSFHLWGDVPALMPFTRGPLKSVGEQNEMGEMHSQSINKMRDAFKVPGFRFDGSGRSFQTASVAEYGYCQCGHSASAHEDRGCLSCRCQRYRAVSTGTKNGNDWFGSGADCSLQRKAASGSKARKAASAMIAKIPLPLSRHIAVAFKPCAA